METVKENHRKLFIVHPLYISEAGICVSLMLNLRARCIEMLVGRKNYIVLCNENKFV